MAHTAVVDTIEYRNDAAFQATAGFPGDHFIGEWTGVVVIKQGGSYTFASSSDDGSHIWIDGMMVVNNEGIHGVQEVRGTVDLTAGRHRVKVDFFENAVNPRIPDLKPQTPNPRDPKPQTPNPKPHTPHPTPPTLKANPKHNRGARRSGSSTLARTRRGVTSS